VLTAGPAIGALVAAALYGATYLSLLYLLRFPRNWLPPSLSSSLVTGSLAAVTVAFVSASPGGVDYGALFFLTAFLALLSGIIAAPAIAFRPASRLIEFLARHGNRAGLWMLAPAVVAVFATSNARLQGVMVAAMAIELVWFLRHRPNDRGRLYSVGGHDFSVLKAQAKGDIGGFAGQHGIHELVLSDGAVSWRGCGKETPPCPFNFYVNRLGLNTAPCCREHMADLSRYVATCLRDLGVVHWLEGGSLLGAVREDGRLLAWEDDIDISVVLDQGDDFDALAAGLAKRCAQDGYHIDVFRKKKFIAVSYDQPGFRPFSWERNRMRGEIRLDIAVFRNAVSAGKPVLERETLKGAMPLTESGWYGVPKETVLPTSTIRFLGQDIACPKEPETYLGILYGDFKKTEFTYVAAAAAKTRRSAAVPNGYGEAVKQSLSPDPASAARKPSTTSDQPPTI
jgi:hypothetical protein